VTRFFLFSFGFTDAGLVYQKQLALIEEIVHTLRPTI